ncbi:MAG: methyltransferase [Cytophagales bacterium]
MKRKNQNKRKTTLGIIRKIIETFSFKQFDVFQNSNVFKISTEACLFAASLPVEYLYQNALEVGSGTGVISLMLAQRHPNLKIEALDIDREAFELTSKNFRASPWNLNLEAHLADFRNFKSEHNFDLIFSNPPFFFNSLKSSNQKKNQAKHLLDFNHTELLSFASENLNQNGEIWLLLPEKESLDLQSRCPDDLFLFKLIEVKKWKNTPTFRHFLGFSKTQKTLEKEELLIYDEGLNYSRRAFELLQAFYLKL